MTEFMGFTSPIRYKRALRSSQLITKNQVYLMLIVILSTAAKWMSNRTKGKVYILVVYFLTLDQMVINLQWIWYFIVD